MEFVIRERSFQGACVDQGTQKYQACGGSFKLVGSKGYAHLRGHVENGLDIVGTDGRVGWDDHEVVVKVVH